MVVLSSLCWSLGKYERGNVPFVRVQSAAWPADLHNKAVMAVHLPKEHTGNLVLLWKLQKQVTASMQQRRKNVFMRPKSWHQSKQMYTCHKASEGIDIEPLIHIQHVKWQLPSLTVAKKKRKKSKKIELCLNPCTSSHHAWSPNMSFPKMSFFPSHTRRLLY